MDIYYFNLSPFGILQNKPNFNVRAGLLKACNQGASATIAPMGGLLKQLAANLPFRLATTRYLKDPAYSGHTIAAAIQSFARSR